MDYSIHPLHGSTKRTTPPKSSHIEQGQSLSSSSSNQKMKDSPSSSSGRLSSSRLPRVPTSVINAEFEVISTHTPLSASSVHSKKSPSISASSSIYSKKSPSISSNTSNALKSNKWSRNLATKDERDDYSGRVSRSVTLGKSEDVLISLPASMANPPVGKKHSEAVSKISKTRNEVVSVTHDLDGNSSTSPSARSRKSTSSSSNSAKSKKHVSVPASTTNQDYLDQLRAMVMLNGVGSGFKPEVPSVTASMTAKRRQLKAKEVEIEQKRMALEEAERRNMQREKEINEKVSEMRRKDEEEVAAKMQSLKALELKLKEKKRELKMKEEESGREINSKFKAIKMSEKERLKREKEIEQRMIDFAQKEQEINERLAEIDAASVARKKKEEKLEVKVIVFARKEKEIKDRLAAIEAASIARRKKEKASSIARKKNEKAESVKQQNIIESRLINDTSSPPSNAVSNKKVGKKGKFHAIFQKKKTYEA